MTERAKNRWQGPALYPSGPYTGVSTRTEPATKLVVPREPFPAQYANWFQYQSQVDALARLYRGGLNSFVSFNASAASPTAISPCVEFGGFLVADGTNVAHARSAEQSTWTKVAGSGAFAVASWAAPGGTFYAFYTVASGVPQKAITSGGSSNIVTLASIDVAPRGVAQHGSNILVIGTESAALKAYKGSGTTWAAMTNPGSTTITDPQTLVCSQKVFDHDVTASGPIAIIPRGAASGTDDYIYSTDLTSLAKGSKTGLVGTYVGCDYDVLNDVWVMAMYDSSTIAFYTSSTPAGPWTDTGLLKEDVANSADNQFLIYDGVYVLCLPAGGVTAFPTAFDKPAATVIFSMDQGATWEDTNAAVGKPSGTGTLQMVKGADRIIVANEKTVCFSGALR